MTNVKHPEVQRIEDALRAAFADRQEVTLREATEACGCNTTRVAVIMVTRALCNIGFTRTYTRGRFKFIRQIPE